MASRCIVVDTSSVWGDLLLKSVSWDVLAACASEDPNFYIRFSATVVDEIAAKYIEQAHAETNHLSDKIQKLLIDSEVVDAARDALDEQCQGIKDYLEDRIVNQLHGGLMPWPAQSHEQIVDRTLKRVPPFDQKGRGYRDTLIWLAAVDEAHRLDAELIVVSKDAAAFRAPGTQQFELHPDLVAEAAANGVAASLVATVKGLVTDVRSSASGVDSKASMVSEALKSNVLTFLEEHLGEPGVTPALDAQAIGLPSLVANFEINYVEDVRDLTLNPVRTIAGRQIVYSFTANAHVELEVSVYEGSAWEFEWPIQHRYGHGDVSALAHKDAAVSGLITLSATGEPVAVDEVEWSAEP